MNGFLVVNKPQKISSHGVVERIRRIFKTKKVGHTGTLDPLATGVLVLCLGKATRLARFLLVDPKTYLAEMTLGIETDSMDATGEIVEKKACKGVDKKRIKEAISKFEGPIKQVPPMTSAIKVGGKPLYVLARQGIEIERQPRDVNIEKIELLKFRKEELKVDIRVICSKGTYIRVLCSDIGKDLGCGAHLSALVRERAGRFVLEESYSVEDLKVLREEERLNEALIDINKGLENYPAVYLNKGQERLVKNGHQVTLRMVAKKDKNVMNNVLIRVLDFRGELVAIARWRGDLSKRLKDTVGRLEMVLSE